MTVSRRLLTSSLIALACVLPAARAAEPEKLTLEAALNAVDQSSLNVLLSRELLQQALATSALARANILPQITADATQRRSRTASVGDTGARGTVSNRFDAVLNARLDFFNPTRLATFKANRAAVEVAELDLAQARQTVLQSVASFYFLHLRNLRRLDVLNANVSRARALLELAQRQFGAGVATQIDVTRAEAQVAIQEQALLQQQTVLTSSELQIKQLLALDLTRPLELADFAVKRGTTVAATDGAEQTAFERRADLLRANQLLEQNELEVRAAKFGRLPTVAITGAYGRATEVAFDGVESNTWSGAVAVSLPLFDSGRTGSLVSTALSRRRAQQYRVNDLKLRIGAEVRLATQDARSRFAQVEVAERSLSLAQDELRLAQTRFEQGVADNREIIEAQNRLAVASDNRVEAIYQYNLSRLEFARVRGEVKTILTEQVD